MKTHSTNRCPWPTTYVDTSCWAGRVVGGSGRVFELACLEASGQLRKEHIGRVRHDRALLAASAADVIGRAL